MDLGDLFCRSCIQQAPAPEFYFYATLCLVATVAGLWLAKRNFHRARLIEDMPTSRIRSASQGYVELIGVAHRAEAPRISPLSNTLCLWWRYTIERYQKGRRSGGWVVIEKKHSEAPFYLRDDTGVCRIVPRGAEIHTRHRRSWRGYNRRPTGAPTTFDTGWATAAIGLGGNYRYTEYLLLDGDPLYCLGRFETDASGERTLSIADMTGDLLRHWKADFNKLLDRFDANGDGQLDLQEWQTVRDAAEREALNTLADKPAEVEHELRKPQSGGLPFIIASDVQDKLSVKYRWKAFGGAVLFLAAGSLLTWLVSARFA